MGKGKFALLVFGVAAAVYLVIDPEWECGSVVSLPANNSGDRIGAVLTTNIGLDVRKTIGLGPNPTIELSVNGGY